MIITLSQRAKDFIDIADDGGNITSNPSMINYIRVIDDACRTVGITDGAVYPFDGNSLNSFKWNLLDMRDTDSAFRLSYVNDIEATNKGVKAFNISISNQSTIETFFTPSVEVPIGYTVASYCSEYLDGFDAFLYGSFSDNYSNYVFIEERGTPSLGLTVGVCNEEGAIYNSKNGGQPNIKFSMTASKPTNSIHILNENEFSSFNNPGVHTSGSTISFFSITNQLSVSKAEQFGRSIAFSQYLIGRNI